METGKERGDTQNFGKRSDIMDYKRNKHYKQADTAKDVI